MKLKKSTNYKNYERIRKHIIEIYKLCEELGVQVEISFTDHNDKYADECLVWSKAEAWEIKTLLDHKGTKITQDDIDDFIIDMGLEEQKKNKTNYKE